MPLDFLTLMTVMAANLFMISAAFKLARGMLGAFTDQYPSFRTPHPVNLAAAVATNVSLVLGTVALLVAWRSEAEHKLRTLAMTDGLTGVLNRRGFNGGEPDGKLGAGTRAAVKAAQIKLGLPADSYPTTELIERLRR